MYNIIKLVSKKEKDIIKNILHLKYFQVYIFFWTMLIHIIIKTI